MAAWAAPILAAEGSESTKFAGQRMFCFELGRHEVDRPLLGDQFLERPVEPRHHAMIDLTISPNDRTRWGSRKAFDAVKRPSN
jgi:hypothetical protein